MTRSAETPVTRVGASRFWQKAKTASKWLFLTALFVAVLLILAAVAYDVYGSARLRSAHRAATSVKLPLSYDQWLQGQPEVPDTMNAALYYEAAFSLMRVRGLPAWFEEVFPETYRSVRTESQAAKTVGAALHDPRTPLPGDVLAEVKALVESRGDIVAAVHDGAALSRARYRVDWDLRRKPMPYFEPMRTTVPLVVLGAWVDVEEGRISEAMGKIRDALGLARSFSGQPSVVLATREREGVSTALNAGLARVLARTKVSDADLAELQDYLQAYDAEYPELRALEGILALDCDLRLALWEGRKSFQEEGTNFMPGFLLAGYLKSDEAFLINYFLGKFKTRGAHARPPRFYYLANVRSNHLDYMVEEISSTRATLRAAVHAISAARHKNDNGDWPPDIGDSTGLAHPDDPFGAGDALMYRRDGSGIIVYSVGPNGRDDGGRPDLVDVESGDGQSPDYTADDVGVRLWNQGEK